MVGIDHLSDSELRQTLAEYGFQAGPVTDSSRKVLLKKLKLLMVQQGRSKESTSTSKRRSNSSYFSSGEHENDSLHLNRITSSSISNIRKQREERPFSADRILHKRDTNSSKLKTNSHAYDAKKGIPSNIKLSSKTISASESHSFAPGTASDQYDFKPSSDSDDDVLSKKRQPYSVNTFQSNDFDSESYSSSVLSHISQKWKNGENDCRNSHANTLINRQKFSRCESDGVDTLNSSTRFSNPPFQSKFVQILSGSLSEDRNMVRAQPSICDTVDCKIKSVMSMLSLPRWTVKSVLSVISHRFKTAKGDTKFGRNSLFLSIILLIVAALFFIFLGIVYFDMRSKNSTLSHEGYTNNYPVCSQGTSQESFDMCIEAEYLLDAVKLAKMLHLELFDRAIKHKCKNAQSPIMTHHEVVQWIVKEKKYNLKSNKLLKEVIWSVKVLVMSNPHWGIHMTDIPLDENVGAVLNRQSLMNAGSMHVAEPNLPLFCYLKVKLLNLLFVLTLVSIGASSLYGLKLLIQFYITQRERDKAKVYSMVERIIELLVKNHYELVKNQLSGMPRYLVVNHVRDQLIPPSDRKLLSKVWEKAVEWINNSESRVRCELQSISGEEFAVWRWLSSPYSNTDISRNLRSNEQSTPTTTKFGVNSI